VDKVQGKAKDPAAVEGTSAIGSNTESRKAILRGQPCADSLCEPCTNGWSNEEFSPLKDGAADGNAGSEFSSLRVDLKKRVF
jgi:hypothetical protein